MRSEGPWISAAGWGSAAGWTPWWWPTSLGLEVTQRPLRKLKELKIGEFVCIARRLEPEWKRWCVAHAIGHMLMHPGNHVWTRRHTGLGAQVRAGGRGLRPHAAAGRA